MLETDCKSLANLLNTDAQIRSPQFGLILDIKATLALFADYKIAHVPRECIKLAHQLAVEARLRGDQEISANVPVNM